jgi:hypothetical protein
MSDLISSYTTLNTWSYTLSGTLLAMTFPNTGSIYTKIDYVQIPLIRVGTVSGNITVSIYATSGGAPTGSALGSTTIAASSVATSGTNWYTFDFGTDISVTPGKQYTIVKQDSSSNSSNYIGWRRSTNPDYASGQGYTKAGAGAWEDFSRDFGFYVYGYGPPQAVQATTTSNVASTSMDIASNTGDDTGATITARGFYYSSTNEEAFGTTVNVSSGGGAFSTTLSSLSPGTTYYIRAWATNAAGTAVGTVKTQATTAVAPTVTTSACSDVMPTSATGNGNITATGGASVTRRGFCYKAGTSGDPTTSDSTAYDDGTFGTGAYTKSITSLSGGTGYRVRAYAVNSVGTSYGDTVQLTTSAVDAPTVTTTTTSLVGRTQVVFGGNVTDSGDAAVTDRGIYWGTTEGSQTNKISSTSGIGTFTIFKTGLDASTLYYFKAFATNSAGTSYGDILHFTTGNSLSAEDVAYLPPFNKA